MFNLFANCLWTKLCDVQTSKAIVNILKKFWWTNRTEKQKHTQIIIRWEKLLSNSDLSVMMPLYNWGVLLEISLSTSAGICPICLKSVTVVMETVQ